MINRLEANWKLDGFVDEQRYYCSEMPMSVISLPEPKAVLAGDARTYTDTDIALGGTYYVRIGASKNNIEKISGEFIADTLKNKVVSQLNFENGIIDSKEKIWSANGGAAVTANWARFSTQSLNLSGTTVGKYIATANNPDFDFKGDDFSIELSFYLLSNNNFHTFLSKRFDNGSTESFCFFYFSEKIYFDYTTNGSTVKQFVVDQILEVNQVYDIQLIRHGNQLELGLGGSVIGTYSIGSDVIYTSNMRVVIGQLNDTLAGGYFDGYIDEFRITKGARKIAAKYSAF